MCYTSSWDKALWGTRPVLPCILNHYWKLVTGGVISGRDGPTAIQIKVGWVLSGPVEGVLQEGSAVKLISTHTLKVGVQDASDCKTSTID